MLISLQSYVKRVIDSVCCLRTSVWNSSHLQQTIQHTWRSVSGDTPHTFSLKIISLCVNEHRGLVECGYWTTLNKELVLFYRIMTEAERRLRVIAWIRMKGGCPITQSITHFFQFHGRRCDFRPGGGAMAFWGPIGAPKRLSGAPHEGAPNNNNLACFYRTFLVGPTLSNFWSS